VKWQNVIDIQNVGDSMFEWEIIDGNILKVRASQSGERAGPLEERFDEQTAPPVNNCLFEAISGNDSLIIDIDNDADEKAIKELASQLDNLTSDFKIHYEGEHEAALEPLWIIQARNEYLTLFNAEESSAPEESAWDAFMRVHAKQQHLNLIAANQSFMYLIGQDSFQRGNDTSEKAKDHLITMAPLGCYHFFRYIFENVSDKSLHDQYNAFEFTLPPRAEFSPKLQIETLLQVLENTKPSHEMREIILGYPANHREEEEELDLTEDETRKNLIDLIIKLKDVRKITISTRAVKLDDTAINEICKAVRDNQIKSTLSIGLLFTENNINDKIANIIAFNQRAHNAARADQILSGKAQPIDIEPIKIKLLTGEKRNKYPRQRQLHTQFVQTQQQEQQVVAQQDQQQQTTQQQILQQREQMSQKVSQQDSSEIEKSASAISNLVDRETVKAYLNFVKKYNFSSSEEIEAFWDKVAGGFLNELTPKPHEKITKMTQAAFLEAAKFSHIFEHGVNFHNLPIGFFVRTIEEKDQSVLVLCYEKNAFSTERELNPLTVELTVHNAALTRIPECDDRMFCEYGSSKWESAEKGLQTNKKRFNDVFYRSSIPNDREEKTFLKTLNSYIQLDYQEPKDRLGPYQAIFDKIFKIGNKNANKAKRLTLLTNVVRDHGSNAFLSLLNRFEKLEQITYNKRNSAFDYFITFILDQTDSLDSLLTKEGLEALDLWYQWQQQPNLCNWLNHLIEAHIQSNNPVELCKITSSFQYFLDQLTMLSKTRQCGSCELPTTCEINNASHFQITLDRLLYILNRSIDPSEQLQYLKNVDLSAHGAYFSAYFHGYYQVTEAMELTARSRYDARHSDGITLYDSRETFFKKMPGELFLIASEACSDQVLQEKVRNLHIELFRYIGSSTHIRPIADYQKLYNYYMQPQFANSARSKEAQLCYQIMAVLFSTYVLTGSRAYTEDLESTLETVGKAVTQVKDVNTLINLAFTLLFSCKDNTRPSTNELVSIMGIIKNLDQDSSNPIVSAIPKLINSPLAENGYHFFEQYHSNQHRLSADDVFSSQSESAGAFTLLENHLLKDENDNNKWTMQLAQIASLFASFNNTSTIKEKTVGDFVNKLQNLEEKSKPHYNTLIRYLCRIDFEKTSPSVYKDITLEKVSEIVDTLAATLAGTLLDNISENKTCHIPSLLEGKFPGIQFKIADKEQIQGDFKQSIQSMSEFFTPSLIWGMKYIVQESEPDETLEKYIKCGATSVYHIQKDQAVLHTYHPGESLKTKIEIGYDDNAKWIALANPPTDAQLEEAKTNNTIYIYKKNLVKVAINVDTGNDNDIELKLESTNTEEPYHLCYHDGDKKKEIALTGLDIDDDIQFDELPLSSDSSTKLNRWLARETIKNARNNEKLRTIAQTNGAALHHKRNIKITFALALASESYIKKETEHSPEPSPFYQDCLEIQQSAHSQTIDIEEFITKLISVINKVDSAPIKKYLNTTIYQNLNDTLTKPIQEQIDNSGLNKENQRHLRDFLTSSLKSTIFKNKQHAETGDRISHILGAWKNIKNYATELIKLHSMAPQSTDQTTPDIINLTKQSNSFVSMKKLMQSLIEKMIAPENVISDIKKIIGASKKTGIAEKAISHVANLLSLDRESPASFKMIYRYGINKIEGSDDCIDLLREITDLLNNHPSLQNIISLILSDGTSVQEAKQLKDEIVKLLKINQSDSRETEDHALILSRVHDLIICKNIPNKAAFLKEINQLDDAIYNTQIKSKIIKIFISGYHADEKTSIANHLSQLNNVENIKKLETLYQYCSPKLSEAIDNLENNDFDKYRSWLEKNPTGRNRDYSTEFSTTEVERVISQIVDKVTGKPIDIELQQQLYSSFYYINLIGYAYAFPTKNCPICKFSTMELKETIQSKKDKLKNEANSDQALKIKLELIALFREAMYRALSDSNKIRMPYSTQIISVILSTLIDDNIMLEINTGEGKNLISALVAALHWAQGYASDISSSDSKLANTDHLKNLKFYDYIGANSTTVSGHSDKNTYQPEGINYSTLADFSLYQSRATLDLEALRSGKQRALVCDEADQAALDNETAFNFSPAMDDNDPLINVYAWIYPKILDFINTPEFRPENKADYNMEKDTASKQQDVSNLRKALLDDSSITTVQRLQLKGISNERLSDWIDAAIAADDLVDGRATANSKSGASYEQDYIVIDYERPQDKKQFKLACILADGRPQPHSRWSEGIHQFLHAKLNKSLSKDDIPFDIEPETIYSDSRSVVDQFAMTARRVGVTGTIGSHLEAQEIAETHHARVFKIPTHNKLKRVDHPKQFVDSHKNLISTLKHKIIRDSANKHGHQPLLLLTNSIENAHTLKENIERFAHDHGYNTVQIVDGTEPDEDENGAKKQAGETGTLTIATQIFSRGTDIELSKNAKANGLRVHITNLMFSRQFGQGIGRSGRNGDPGISGCTIAWSDVISQYAGIANQHGIDLEKCRQQKQRLAAVEKLEKAIYAQAKKKRERDNSNALIMSQYQDRFDVFFNVVKSSPNADSLKVFEQQILLQKSQFIRDSEQALADLNNDTNEGYAEFAKKKWEHSYRNLTEQYSAALSTLTEQSSHPHNRCNAIADLKKRMQDHEMQVSQEAALIKYNPSPKTRNPTPTLYSPYSLLQSQNQDQTLQKQLAMKNQLWKMASALNIILDEIKNSYSLPSKVRKSLTCIFSKFHHHISTIPTNNFDVSETPLHNAIKLFINKLIANNIHLERNHHIPFSHLNQITLTRLISLLSFSNHKDEPTDTIKVISESISNQLRIDPTPKNDELSQPPIRNDSNAKNDKLSQSQMRSLAGSENVINRCYLKNSPANLRLDTYKNCYTTNNIDEIKRKLKSYTGIKFSIMQHTISRDRRKLARKLYDDLDGCKDAYQTLQQSFIESILDDVTHNRNHKPSSYRSLINDTLNKMIIDSPPKIVSKLLAKELTHLSRLITTAYNHSDPSEPLKKSLTSLSKCLSTDKSNVERIAEAIRILHTLPDLNKFKEMKFNYILEQVNHIVSLYPFTQESIDNDKTQSIPMTHFFNMSFSNAPSPADSALNKVELAITQMPQLPETQIEKIQQIQKRAQHFLQSRYRHIDFTEWKIESIPAPTECNAKLTLSYKITDLMNSTHEQELTINAIVDSTTSKVVFGNIAEPQKTPVQAAAPDATLPKANAKAANLIAEHTRASNTLGDTPATPPTSPPASTPAP